MSSSDISIINSINSINDENDIPDDENDINSVCHTNSVNSIDSARSHVINTFQDIELDDLSDIHYQGSPFDSSDIRQKYDGNNQRPNYDGNNQRDLPDVFHHSTFQHDFTPNNSSEIVRDIIEVEESKEHCICLILVLVIIGVILGAVYGTQ